MSLYPFFSPPEHLAEKDSNLWSSKETTEYKEWMLGVMDERILYLLEYLNVSQHINAIESLTLIGEKFSKLVFSEEFSVPKPDGRGLSNRGYAMAADIGLLIARELLREHGDALRWKIVRAAKLDLSYKMPALYSFSTPMKYFEPIGASIPEAHALLNGPGDSKGWATLFDYMNNNVVYQK